VPVPEWDPIFLEELFNLSWLPASERELIPGMPVSELQAALEPIQRHFIPTFIIGGIP